MQCPVGLNFDYFMKTVLFRCKIWSMYAFHGMICSLEHWTRNIIHLLPCLSNDFPSPNLALINSFDCIGMLRRMRYFSVKDTLVRIPNFLISWLFVDAE